MSQLLGQEDSGAGSRATIPTVPNVPALLMMFAFGRATIVTSWRAMAMYEPCFPWLV
jgi:hypothetical protein